MTFSQNAGLTITRVVLRNEKQVNLVETADPVWKPMLGFSGISNSKCIHGIRVKATDAAAFWNITAEQNPEGKVAEMHSSLLDLALEFSAFLEGYARNMIFFEILNSLQFNAMDTDAG